MSSEHIIEINMDNSGNNANEEPEYIPFQKEINI